MMIRDHRDKLPRKLPWRKLFRFRCDFPTVSDRFRSLDLFLLLPGLMIEFKENALDFERRGRVLSGCRIGIFNPFGEIEAGAVGISRWLVDSIHVSYCSHGEKVWHEAPDGWRGAWEIEIVEREAWPEIRVDARPILGDISRQTYRQLDAT